LKPGEEKDVYLSVSQKAMAYFNEEKDAFEQEDIPYIAYVGNCSAGNELQSVSFKF